MAAVALIAALAMSRSSSPSDKPILAPPSPVGVAVVTGPATRFGVPVGFAHDEDGARAAAVSAVALTGEVARAGFVTRRDMIGVLATAQYAPELTRATATQLEATLGELAAEGIAASQVVFRELPLTAHVDRFDGDTALVRVWSVVVAGADGRGAPRQLWRTVSLQLVWDEGRWLIDDWTAAPGPTPALATGAPIAALADVVDTVTWPAAGGG